MNYSDYQAKAAAIAKRKAIAEQLSNAALSGGPGLQVVSGRVVKQGALSSLLPIAQALAGSYAGKKADKEGGELEKQRGAEIAAALAGVQAEKDPAARRQGAVALEETIAGPEAAARSAIARELAPKPDVGPLVTYTGPDGKPVYGSREEANGKSPYITPAGGSTPSEIAAYEYYKKLSPAEQATYLQVKRNTTPYSIEDVAGGKNVFNKVTGDLKPTTTAQQEAAGAQAIASAKASGATGGKAVTEAQLDLPRVVANAEQSIKAIQELKSAPGFEGIFGLRGMIPNLPGGDAANAQTRLDQVKGKTFLEAFNSLRGAGQITEVEGKKATDAIARLDKAQSAEEARTSLDDLESVITQAVERAKIKAQGGSLGVQQPQDLSKTSDDELLRMLNGG